MNRTIEYKITAEQDGLRVEQFLRRKGYSGQNIAEIKRMPKSVLVNGEHYYMRQTFKSLHRIYGKCPCLVLPGAGKAIYFPLL